MLNRSRPSPATVLAVIALAFAIAGSAVAGTNDLSGKITKSKVKAIAKKQIKLAAPGLSVASATDAANLGGKPAGAYASSAVESPHLVGTAGEPAFENGWANFGAGFSEAGFYKDPFGLVHLQGSFSGTSGNPVFTLPAGYRPAATLLLPMAAGGAAGGNLVLYPTGLVQPFCPGGGACTAGVDGLSFRPG